MKYDIARLAGYIIFALLFFSCACLPIGDVNTEPGQGSISMPVQQFEGPVSGQTGKQPNGTISGQPESGRIFGMKGVALELPEQDFADMKNAGIDIISTEWGMEEGVGRARIFLDKAQAAGLKVVMDGGFSPMAWGFTEDDWDDLPAGKWPVWQREVVQRWVNALKDHPAIYAWDICNEFGENLPSGVQARNSEWPESRITTEQIKRAKADVLAVDPTRPIHVRMYGWDIAPMPAHISELLDNRIPDIISLNLYSNYLDHGRLQWPDVIADAGAYFVDGIKQKAPGIRVWVSLGAFEYLREFKRPTQAALARDIRESAKIAGLDGITFFCWGPVRQWDDKCNWYLPTTGQDLWQTIKSEIALLNKSG